MGEASRGDGGVVRHVEEVVADVVQRESQVMRRRRRMAVADVVLD